MKAGGGFFGQPSGRTFLGFFDHQFLDFALF